MEAKIIDVMGNDLKVVNAARVSFAKQHDCFDDKSDTGLINYLAKNGHWTPFAHCQATFHVKTPIFVARQLVKHQIGLVWNEISRRYVNDEPEFYWPDEWRLRPDHIKQGSGDEVLDRYMKLKKGGINDRCKELEESALGLYRDMNHLKIAPEMARMVLPQNMYTEWHWTGSLMAFARVCEQRLDSHAQKETRDVAQYINDDMAKAFPVSWNALMRSDYE